MKLKRSLPTTELTHLDPFLLLDEFKSEESTEYIGGFPDHPHRGFETVTYMLAGVMEHKDHRGNTGRIAAGDVQWMTAGRGIIHSEMPKQHEGLMWGFQLWINLPAKEKMCEPRYQDVPHEAIPEVIGSDGTRVRVIAGEFRGTPGAVKGITTRPLYLDIALARDGQFAQEIPQGHTALCYVFEGQGEFGGSQAGEGRRLSTGQLGVLGDGDGLSARTDGGVRFLLLAAQPLLEPVARLGPFVMNTRGELLQALQDYDEGKFLD